MLTDIDSSASIILMKLSILTAIRGFFWFVVFDPNAWLYWDEKVLKAREEAKKNA